MATPLLLVQQAKAVIPPPKPVLSRQLPPPRLQTVLPLTKVVKVKPVVIAVMFVKHSMVVSSVLVRAKNALVVNKSVHKKVVLPMSIPVVMVAIGKKTKPVTLVAMAIPVKVLVLQELKDVVAMPLKPVMPQVLLGTANPVPMAVKL